MKVSLAKHGGWAAGVRLGRPSRALNAAELSPADAAELTRLVAAAKTDPPAPERRAGRAPDAMSYTITVENGQTVVLTRSDSSMSPGFAALLGFLAKHINAK